MEEDPKRIRPATHAGAFRACPRTELAAVVDTDPTRVEHARRLFAGVQGFRTVEQMLEVIQPEIVSVATPAAAHREVVEACARAGVRAVICEKPIALSAADGQRMIEACADAGTLLLINHTRRFDPTLRRLQEEIAAGKFGDITQATAYYTAGLLNTGTHIVDLLRFFLGDVAWTIAVPNLRASHPAGDFNADALVGFVSGARAVLQVQEVMDYAIFTLRLHGRLGVAVIERFGFEVDRMYVRDCAEFSGYKELDVRNGCWEGQARSLMGALADHVVACLDGRETLASRGEDGLAALKVLLALKESAEGGGRRIELTAQTET